MTEKTEIITVVVTDEGAHVFPDSYANLNTAIEALIDRRQILLSRMTIRKSDLTPPSETYQEMEDDIMGEDNYSVAEEFFSGDVWTLAYL